MPETKCPADKVTAWFVYEGKEDVNYSSFCFSNRNLNEIIADGLYKKPTVTEILDLLRLVNLL